MIKISFLLIIGLATNSLYANQTHNNTKNLIKIYLSINELKDKNKQLTGQLEATNKRLDNLKKEINRLSKLVVHSTGKKQTVNKGISAKTLYKNAKNELGKAQFEKAIQLFQKHLKKYPSSNNTNSIYYWLGRAYYYNAKYKKSIKYYALFEKKAKNDKRVPKAIYAKAQSYLKISYKTKAKKEFKRLIKKYSKSSYAKKAKQALKKI